MPGFTRIKDLKRRKFENKDSIVTTAREDEGENYRQQQEHRHTLYRDWDLYLCNH